MLSSWLERRGRLAERAGPGVCGGGLQQRKASSLGNGCRSSGHVDGLGGRRADEEDSRLLSHATALIVGAGSRRSLLPDTYGLPESKSLGPPTGPWNARSSRGRSLRAGQALRGADGISFGRRRRHHVDCRPAANFHARSGCVDVKARKYRRLLFVDLAVPRDVAADVHARDRNARIFANSHYPGKAGLRVPCSSTPSRTTASCSS